MCIRDSCKISTIQSKLREIDEFNLQTSKNMYDKCTLIENNLTSVKNELRGEINKKLTGVTERVIITRDLHNEIELETFSYENRAIHPMRFINQTREYNRFSNSSWEVQLTKIIKCFKGSSIVWAEAHRSEWDCYEAFERAFKGKYWTEDEQEILRSCIMGTSNFIGQYNDIQ